MKLVDTHTHTWGEDTDELPWQANVLPPDWCGPYTHADLVAEMDHVGVDEAVVVSTPLYGRGPRANEYTVRSIESHPERLYGVGHADYFGVATDHTDEESTVRQRVRRVVGHERMLGVRMYAALRYETIPTELDREGDWILDDRLDPIFDELARQDACLYVFPKAEQLSQVERIAAENPDLSVVVDHMAWPDETTAADEGPWANFEQVADRENVHVKVSSLPRSAASKFPYSDLHDYVRNLVDWFGPERLLLGSDYPWMDDWAGYGDCLRWVEEVEFLSARDLSWLSYRSFERLHGL